MLEMLKRIERAYKIIELNSQAPMILEKHGDEKLFAVRSSINTDGYYTVDADIQTCTCPDFAFRSVKCKHILATEFASTSRRWRILGSWNDMREPILRSPLGSAYL